MDKEILVNRIKDALTAYHNDAGVDIDYFNVAPTYGDAVNGLYTLSVSAPTLADTSCYTKTDQLINYLYGQLAPDELKQIAAVRFFDSKDELKQQVSLSIIGSSCDCEHILHAEPELVEV